MKLGLIMGFAGSVGEGAVRYASGDYDSSAARQVSGVSGASGQTVRSPFVRAQLVRRWSSWPLQEAPLLHAS